MPANPNAGLATTVGEIGSEDMAVIQRLRDGRDRVKQEMAKVVVGQNDVIDSLLDRPLVPRAHPAARRAGPRQDAHGPHAGPHAGNGVPPRPVHARPDACRHHRHGRDGGRPDDRQAPRLVHAGAGLHQLPACRRNQPYAAQDAGRPAAGHAGRRSLGRPRDLQAQAAVLRRRHAEPDRDGRHLPAARGPARPVHVQPQGAVSDRG